MQLIVETYIVLKKIELHTKILAILKKELGRNETLKETTADEHFLKWVKLRLI